MRKKKKTIEFFTLQLEDSGSLTLRSLLTHSKMNGQEISSSEKETAYKILKETPEYIVGIVETSRGQNVPPKKHKKTRKLAAIGLDVEEGLAYGNVFLYEPKRNVFMYEVNKNGCSVGRFLNHLYECANQNGIGEFSLQHLPLLTPDEYKRMQQMKVHKSLEFHVANPEKIANDRKHTKGALSRIARDAAETGSDKMIIRYEVSGERRKTGLSESKVNSIVDGLLSWIDRSGSNDVQKIVVKGYDYDEDHPLHEIDLIADRYKKSIELDGNREHSNLLESQREKEMSALYENCQSDLTAILGVK